MADLELKLFGILGNPLSHSLSPAMHQYLLNEIGQMGRYHTFEVPEQRLADKVRELKSLGFRGFNVTVPYKQAIMSHLDDIDEEARFIGAVNTVLLKNGRLSGFNTDSHGFIKALKINQVQTKDNAAVVLGAGGAARAVIFNLIRCGIKKLFIFNRTLQRAESLSGEVAKFCDSAEITFGELKKDEVTRGINACQLIVNATPLGMWPNVNQSPYLFESDASGLAAIDLIYNPLQTMFLKTAEQAGAKTIDGLDMFIFQGVEALKIWLEEEINFDLKELRNYLIHQSHNQTG